MEELTTRRHATATLPLVLQSRLFLELGRHGEREANDYYVLRSQRRPSEDAPGRIDVATTVEEMPSDPCRRPR